jgi:hypothetical protein
MEEWMLVSREHLHTVFTDRINVPCTDHIDGTLKLHMVSGTWECGEQLVMVLGNDETWCNKLVETFKLKIASMSCVCTSCREEANPETHIFKGLWNEQEEWIHELLANEQKPATSPEERESFKLVFLQCSEHLQRVLDSATMLGQDGSTKSTIKIMKDYLCLHSQPTAGRKHKFAK